MSCMTYQCKKCRTTWLDGDLFYCPSCGAGEIDKHWDEANDNVEEAADYEVPSDYVGGIER